MKHVSRTAQSEILTFQGSMKKLITFFLSSRPRTRFLPFNTQYFIIGWRSGPQIFVSSVENYAEFESSKISRK